MMSAPRTPGIHPHNVSRSTIVIDPHPLSTTANGGKIIANKTCKQFISVFVVYLSHNFAGAKVMLFSDICKKKQKKEHLMRGVLLLPKPGLTVLLVVGVAADLPEVGLQGLLATRFVSLRRIDKTIPLLTECIRENMIR